MVFQYVLANLLANNDQALGALFLDGSGETVDLACAEFSPYEMRVIGVRKTAQPVPFVDKVFAHIDFAAMEQERDRLRASGILAGIGIAACLEPSGANSAFTAVMSSRALFSRAALRALAATW